MKRFFLLLIIAIATFLIFAVFKNMDVLQDIWLWLVGFAGLIIQTGKTIFKNIKKLVDNEPETQSDKIVEHQAPPTPIMQNLQPKVRKPDPMVVELTMLRFHDDGHTTLGLLYINNKFYCYTLEDTFNEVKIEKETRITAGLYQVDFNRADTNVTLKYRQQFPDWFTYHLELKNVPNYQGIYIHNGGTHKDTAGCILVSDSFSVSKENKTLTNSKDTFEQMYKFLSRQLSEGKKIQIDIRDEQWIKQLP